VQGLQTSIDAVLQRVRDLRHELHAHPELSFDVPDTAQRVFEVLDSIGRLQIRRGLAGHGIVAVLNADRPGPCVGLRAELDALPIEEQTGLPYASKNLGRMHACGHDGHMACLLGAAMVLAERADDLPGKVKFIFQPAEETEGGAQVMCEQGALEEPHVDCLFALHGWPTLPLGLIATAAGPQLASTNPFELRIKGKGCHAAHPHQGIDPIMVSARIIDGLQTIASRQTNPIQPVVVTVGEIRGGSAANIIPSEVYMKGTIRTLDAEVRRQTVERVRQIVTRTAETFDATAEINIVHGYPVLVNDAGAAGLVLRVAQRVVGRELVQSNPPPSMGAEDFAYYAQRTPAALYRLGLRPPGAGDDYPALHTPRFDFNDDALPIGIRMHCELAAAFLGEPSAVPAKR
jgi:amidohydrolase